MINKDIFYLLNDIRFSRYERFTRNREYFTNRSTT